MRVEVAKHESMEMELKRQIQEKKDQLEEVKKRLERQQVMSKEDKVCNLIYIYTHFMYI